MIISRSLSSLVDPYASVCDWAIGRRRSGCRCSCIRIVHDIPGSIGLEKLKRYDFSSSSKPNWMNFRTRRVSLSAEGEGEDTSASGSGAEAAATLSTLDSLAALGGGAGRLEGDTSRKNSRKASVVSLVAIVVYASRAAWREVAMKRLGAFVWIRV